FGLTGRALLDFLIQRGVSNHLFLYNDTIIRDQKAKSRYQKRGVEFIEGEKNFSRLKEMNALIVSPGINAKSPRFKEMRAAGISLISEIEFASYFIPSKIIAVTGTNGKSTTVSLIHHILYHSGFKSVLAGNIGKPLIAEVNKLTEESVIVLEISSFQLEEVFGFKPHIAVLLNISPDHLDRYSDMNDYVSAKLNICKNQKKDDFLILNHDDKLLKEQVPSEARKIWFSTRRILKGGFFIKDNYVYEKMHSNTREISISNNPLRGVHNLENLLAAIIVSRIMGVRVKHIEAAIKTFKGLSHRIEFLGKIGKVEFINDSKATNIDASLKSLSSFNSGVVLILGGKDKGGDFKVLEEAIKKRAEKVFLIGKAAKTIHQQLLSLREKFVFISDLKEAVIRGYQTLKKSGGIVLLAPGCASFDMFENFEHRGDVFKKEFMALKKKIKNG
ncbi:MAG: UDP-N-acetylmuramoyl-L-alanine--D-glutamate ligase, partial [Candidatus Aminicenantes bacterium]|nr:UDP-N-acetylmuramoyl-L-alanine--D-glutamate ligase [Candidatus Aminicenantes bacterium]